MSSAQTEKPREGGERNRAIGSHLVSFLCGAMPTQRSSVGDRGCKVTAFDCAVQSLHLGILESSKC